MNVSDSYDSYGQQISAYDAGDYIVLKSQKAADIANAIDSGWDDDDETIEEWLAENELPKTFEVGDAVSAFENQFEFNYIEKHCEEGKDYEMECETFEGFDYWDGHNFQTIVLKSETAPVEWEIEDDEEIIADLNAAIENMQWDKEVSGRDYYRCGSAQIAKSRWQGDWEKYSVNLKFYDDEESN